MTKVDENTKFSSVLNFWSTRDHQHSLNIPQQQQNEEQNRNEKGTPEPKSSNGRLERTEDPSRDAVHELPPPISEPIRKLLTVQRSSIDDSMVDVVSHWRQMAELGNLENDAVDVVARPHSASNASNTPRTPNSSLFRRKFAWNETLHWRSRKDKNQNMNVEKGYILLVEILSARNIHQNDAVSGLFAKTRFQKKEKRTETIAYDIAPVFNERFVFWIKNEDENTETIKVEKNLNICISQRGYLYDEVIGNVTIPIDNMELDQTIESWHPLQSLNSSTSSSSLTKFETILSSVRNRPGRSATFALTKPYKMFKNSKSKSLGETEEQPQQMKEVVSKLPRSNSQSSLNPPGEMKDSETMAEVHIGIRKISLPDSTAMLAAQSLCSNNRPLGKQDLDTYNKILPDIWKNFTIGDEPPLRHPETHHEIISTGKENIFSNKISQIATKLTTTRYKYGRETSLRHDVL